MDIHTLKIDEEFMHLIHPLKKSELLQLESNLISEGCKDPIVTWNGFIVDGHNRYEICTKHNIPFNVVELDLDCREAVIAWICATQLGRHNISDEIRKFLIGMQYESEKVVAQKRNIRGSNPYSPIDTPTMENIHYNGGQITAQRIADENHISQGTVQKYAKYTRALEEIGKKEPKLVPKILSGHYKISHENVVELSRLSAEEIQKFNRKIDKNPYPFIQYTKTRNAIQTGRFESIHDDESGMPVPSVKDMPEYDPDAEITGLTLTIPSWCSSIKRAMRNADFTKLSPLAKEKLLLALFELEDKIENLIDTIKEDEYHG